MTAHFPSPTTYEALATAHKQRSARLGLLPPQKPARAVSRPAFVHVGPEADQHVTAYLTWQKMHADGTTPAYFIRLASSILGYSYADVMSHRRGPVSAMRHHLIRMTSERYPQLSSTRLGELFGRDHTVALSALRRDGRVNKYTAKLSVDEVREIKRRAAAGHERIMDIVASYGIVSSTVSNIISGRTWRGIE